MEKSRAIDLLDNLIGMIEDNQDNDYDTALRMAIEALKAQLSQEGATSDQPVATDINVGNNSEIPNSSDCVSRQAAIDALTEHRALYCDNTPETFSKLSYVEKSRVDELDTAIATLVNLPPAQPEPQWIPVSERLPEPRIDVWVNSDLGQMVGYYDEMVELWYGRDYLELIVNAWMPLPQPYQKGATT